MAEQPTQPTSPEEAARLMQQMTDRENARLEKEAADGDQQN